MVKARILVVEDESIVALDIQSRLKNLGYTVSAIASSGEEAIHKVAETQPDLVLMDIKLKGQMDGVKTAEQIRARFDVPVVYLTAYADEATLQRVKVTEPFGYLLKPFEERELTATIEITLYRHKMERKLKESEQWLATTLKSISEAVIATDTQGCIKFMNPVAEALTGWKQAEALGRDASEVFKIINGKTRAPSESPIMKVLQEGAVIELGDNNLLIARDGTEILIDNSAAPIRDDKGLTNGVVLVFRDVTERRQAEEELRQYADKLQAHNKELDAFAHTVAHDLQSPLSSIVGFAELLAEDYAKMPDEDLQSHLQVIARKGRKMSNIIQELMLLAHVRKKEVEPKPLQHMDSIVAEAQHRLADMIEEHQAEIILPTASAWPVTLGYGPWIEEVWVNYLSNAIKYGGRPPRVELGAEVQRDGMVRFWVRDNGPGLKPEDQARLFAPFTQLNQIRAPGHGMGLSIVRRIVEKLGGQVGVESEGIPGHGSVFSFFLPGVADTTTDIRNERKTT